MTILNIGAKTLSTETVVVKRHFRGSNGKSESLNKGHFGQTLEEAEPLSM